MSAATETSKPPTSRAHVCPSETSASGIVRSRRLLRLKLVRKASCRIAAYAPTATMRTVMRTSGSALLSLPSLTTPPPVLPEPGSGHWRGSRRSPPRCGARPAGRLDLVHDPTARHHDDPVAQTGKLERVARLDDRRDAFLRLLAQRAVD